LAKEFLKNFRGGASRTDSAKEEHAARRGALGSKGQSAVCRKREPDEIGEWGIRGNPRGPEIKRCRQGETKTLRLMVNSEVKV